MKISGIIGTCRYEITDDAVLVISPISGMTGQISLEITECGWPWNGANIRKVQLSGKIIAKKSIAGMFGGCTQLEDITDLAKMDVSSVENMESMFYSCISITDISSLADWDVSSVRNSGMFGKTKAGVNPLEEKIPMACPKTGSFIGWKKCCDGKIVKLLIPEDARRSSSLGKKCRCDKAKVLQVFNWDGTQDVIAKSTYNHHFFYFVGETVSVPNFDTDRFNECAPGIHFFMDRDAAEKYR